jgi:osmoprotectant transport system permease protein
MRVLQDAWAYLTDGASWSGDGGMLALLLQQLLLTAGALALALAIGLPLALWLGHLGRGGFLAVNVSTATLGPFGRAGGSTLVALALFALPPILTNAYTAVREVPAEVREAARGMGMTGGQVFWRAEWPLALPLVFSGIRLALVQVWATATIAALVAGPGLGRVITDGFYRTQYGKGIAGAIVVALVALVLELLAAAAQRAVTPAAERRSPGRSRTTSENTPTVGA